MVRQWLARLVFPALFGVMCAACAAPPGPFNTAAADSAPAMAEESGDQMGAMAADTRKIIANSNLSLVVADTEAAMTAIEAIASDAGGYLSDVDLSKEMHGETEIMRGSLTLRVPVSSLAGVLDRLQELAAEVNHLNVDRQDVTEQYSDLDARLRNLQATEAELLVLLTEVRQKPNSDVKDILEVHRSLMDIRSEIETLQGRKNLLDNQIAFSTIRVELIPDSLNRPIVEEAWSATGPARSALRALVATLQDLLTVSIWGILFLVPLLAVLVIPIVALFWLARLLLRRRDRGRE